ncbi:hypothetical protein RRG08_032272 [Elysia crispata]|uniref:Uncharacterized protein n=1 Tax=Elysia crispata TaxID=231223 RepID=A0AAE1AS25_9GAST|nr:hypothetical protein RRG08_032272 [Elysia crispata]
MSLLTVIPRRWPPRSGRTVHPDGVAYDLLAVVVRTPAVSVSMRGARPYWSQLTEVEEFKIRLKERSPITEEDDDDQSDDDIDDDDDDDDDDSDIEDDDDEDDDDGEQKDEGAGGSR